MGCSRSINTIEIDSPRCNFFEAYKSIKNMIIRYNNKKDSSLSFKAFLINTKTIPKFIQLIEESKVLENVLSHKNKNQTDIFESNLDELLKDYKLEENIQIYYKYDECLQVKNNDENNEFIIVDYSFIDNMIGNSKRDKYNNKEVFIRFENESGKGKKIQFLSNEFLGFKEKKVGFYQFTDYVKEKKIDFDPKDEN